MYYKDRQYIGIVLKIHQQIESWNNIIIMLSGQKDEQESWIQNRIDLLDPNL
jgi:hypothetical protein